MKMEMLRGKFTAYYYEYPTGQNNSYGAGGWSMGAKSRPSPQLVIKEPTKIGIKGKSVFLDDVRKLKVTIVRNSNGDVVREDYDIERIINDALPSPLALAAGKKEATL